LFTQWYLPANKELVWVNGLSATVNASFIDITDIYWNSTEPSTAGVQYFTIGSGGANPPTNLPNSSNPKYKVRAVRQFNYQN